MLRKMVNECKINLSITTEGPLLIKSGYSTPFGSDMTPVVTHKDGKPQVFIPGSSIKGVLRSHLEKICRTLQEDSVCDPFLLYDRKDDPHDNTWNDEKYQPVFCGRKFQILKDIWDDNSEIELTNKEAYARSCLACRLFGSTFYTGRFSLNDAYINDNDSPGNLIEKRDGVGIDRYTGGASDGAKFELDVVRAGVEFITELYLRNFEAWQLGGLLLLIKDLEEGFIRIGSGRSRGLGKIKGVMDHLWLGYPKPLVEEMPKNEIWGLGKFLGNEDYGTSIEDILKLDIDLPYQEKGIRKYFDVVSTNGNASESNAEFAQFIPPLQAQAIEYFVKTAKNYKPEEEMSYTYMLSQGGKKDA